MSFKTVSDIHVTGRHRGLPLHLLFICVYLRSSADAFDFILIILPS